MFSRSVNTKSGQAGAALVWAVNAVARKQWTKYKRVRRLPAAPIRPPVTGGDGASFGSTRTLP